jgi:kinesin family protein 5
MSNSIKVVARFRPQNRTEIDLGGQPIVNFESEDTCVLDVCCGQADVEVGKCDSC